MMKQTNAASSLQIIARAPLLLRPILIKELSEKKLTFTVITFKEIPCKRAMRAVIESLIEHGEYSKER